MAMKIRVRATKKAAAVRLDTIPPGKEAGALSVQRLGHPALYEKTKVMGFICLEMNDLVESMTPSGRVCELSPVSYSARQSSVSQFDTESQASSRDFTPRHPLAHFP